MARPGSLTSLGGKTASSKILISYSEVGQAARDQFTSYGVIFHLAL
jgi:hypothetical protein